MVDDCVNYQADDDRVNQNCQYSWEERVEDFEHKKHDEEDVSNNQKLSDEVK